MTGREGGRVEGLTLLYCEEHGNSGGRKGGGGREGQHCVCTKKGVNPFFCMSYIYM